jgi:CRISPR-associated protein Cmr3
MRIKSKDMTIWIIEPRDPLIVRDGRPFGPTPGARATSLSFPFPSTTTGGVRTQAGLPTGIFDIKDPNLRKKQLKALKQLEVRGPLLVQLTPDGNDIAENQWLVPAPLDVVLFPAKQQHSSEEKEARLQQLVPSTFPGALTDFDKEELLLVGMIEQDPSKPLKNAPRYWYWEAFQDWLLNPASYAATTTPLSKLGQSGPYIEQRMHVSIDAKKICCKRRYALPNLRVRIYRPRQG